MPKNFRLKSLFIAIGLFGCSLGAVINFGLQGWVTWLSVLLTLLILLAPGHANFPCRLLVLFSGVGAGMVGWCILHGTFGSQEVGHGWYRGSLDEIGGWSTGIFLGAWRALFLFTEAADYNRIINGS